MALEDLIREAEAFLQAAVSPLMQARRSHDSSRPGTDSKVSISNAAEGLLIEVTKVPSFRSSFTLSL